MSRHNYVVVGAAQNGKCADYDESSARLRATNSSMPMLLFFFYFFFKTKLYVTNGRSLSRLKFRVYFCCSFKNVSLLDWKGNNRSWQCDWVAKYVYEFELEILKWNIYIYIDCGHQYHYVPHRLIKITILIELWMIAASLLPSLIDYHQRRCRHGLNIYILFIQTHFLCYALRNSSALCIMPSAICDNHKWWNCSNLLMIHLFLCCLCLPACFACSSCSSLQFTVSEIRANGESLE